MIDRNDFLVDRVRLLADAGIKLSDVPSLYLPSAYSSLFGNKRMENAISTSEVANLVNSTLLRKEEYGDKSLDEWGRFNHDKSILVQKGLDQSPIIDELILDVIKKLNFKIQSIWPEGKKAVVCLTHDVDSFSGKPYLLMRKMWWYKCACAARIRGRRDESKNYLDKIRRWSAPNYDAEYAFDKWMDLENEYGFRSTFFFFGLKHDLSREGRLYACRDKGVRQTIRRLDANGWEIGLHAGYYDNLKMDALRKQKMNLEDALGKQILGCRHHYLRVRFPESWKLYDDVGFAYSTNMAWGGRDQGFRAGTCFPYRPLAGRALMEIPFHLMDMASIEKPSEYHRLFLLYMQKVKKVGGCLVINFHQQYFDEIEAPGTNEAYRMILKTIAEDNDVGVARLEDVMNCYLARNDATSFDCTNA